LLLLPSPHYPSHGKRSKAGAGVKARPKYQYRNAAVSGFSALLFQFRPAAN
jgi:hypothetical protein